MHPPKAQGKNSASYEPNDLKFFGSWAAGVRPRQKSPRGSDGMLALRSHALLPQAVRARRQAGWAAGLLTPAAWVSRSKTLVGPTRFYADMGCRLFAEGSDTLKEVRRKNEQLRVQLNKTPWPDLKFFTSNGRSYSLPLRAESRDLKHLPSEPVLACLSGFFDGDGSVICVASLSGCYLSIGQSFDQAEVLMLFYETFGGSITRQGSGMGLRKPLLQWMACGQSARNAAQLLMPHSITKRMQLLLAAEWPAAKSRRQDCKAELRALKEYDSAVSGPCRWGYFAGFFDAEGCIMQPRGGASLSLALKQKHPRVLECLREFLAQSLDKDATLAKAGSAHVLLVCGLASCKQILQHLLAAGLLCKVKQAKLAVGLTRENAGQVHTELGRLTGNQKFGKRQDAAGQERARKISIARKKAASLRKDGQLAEALAKLGEVEVLKDEHERLKAYLENRQLVEYSHKVQSMHHNSWHGPFVHSASTDSSDFDRTSVRQNAFWTKSHAEPETGTRNLSSELQALNFQNTSSSGGLLLFHEN